MEIEGRTANNLGPTILPQHKLTQSKDKVQDRPKITENSTNLSDLQVTANIISY